MTLLIPQLLLDPDRLGITNQTQNASVLRALVAQTNNILSRLQHQDARRWNLNPSRLPYQAVTSATTLSAGSYACGADVTLGGFTVTLPNVADVKGMEFYIFKLDASGNTLTVSGDANINGAASVSTTTQYAGWVVFSTGVEWVVEP